VSRQTVRSDRSYLHVSLLQPMLHVTCQRLCTPLAASVFAELHTPEPELSARFYCSLLSWNLRKISDDYWMFELVFDQLR
jgi:hypothetical protein